ncbi:tRNA uridine 5-carboxymethylaminomethyl modification enzyme MnmG, partial [Madurella mycetomatis]
LRGVRPADLWRALPASDGFPARVRERVVVEALYAPYVRIQQAQAARMSRDEGLALPGDLDYDAVVHLSLAERDALKAARPETIAQARRVEGVTPAGLIKLLRYVQRPGRKNGENLAVVEGLDVEGVDDLETLDAKSRVAEL